MGRRFFVYLFAEYVKNNRPQVLEIATACACVVYSMRICLDLRHAAGSTGAHSKKTP